MKCSSSEKKAKLEMSAALALAMEERHVLPIHAVRDGRCSCGGPEINPRCTPGKHPIGELVPRGVHDATADLDVIRSWWEEHPYAGVAMRTGQVSGVVVLDLDSKAAVDEAIRRGLPETDVVRTGRINRAGQKKPFGGGWHWLFRAPEEELCSFTPFPDAEFKAKGLYVVTAPTLHESGRRYKLIPSLSGKLAPVPAWLLRAAHKKHEEPTGGAPIIALDPNGPPIFEGERNSNLFRIACSLRARGADRASALAHLLAVNAARCSPPLARSEVEKIARSACRYEPGTAAPHVTQEVHAALDAYTLVVLDNPWRGVAGHTDRSVLLTLIGFARKFGTMIAAGVRVEVAFRDAAPEAGVSLPTFSNSVRKRLKPSSWVSQDNEDRKPHEAGAFVLLMKRATLKHSYPSSSNGGMGVKDLRVPRLRWRGLGKKTETVLNALLARGGTAMLRELAEALHDPRPWELNRRQLARLKEAGIVELDGGVVKLAENWEAHLLAARGELGELERERADRVRYETQRRLFHDKEVWHE